MASSNWGLDLSPLRVSATYRRLYASGFVTNIGSQATYVTVAYQLKQLTNSALAVGVIGLVELAPLIIFGLYGGVIADHFNRRNIVLASEFGLMCAAIALIINASLAHPSSLMLYVVVAFVAVGDGLQRPSLDALNQELVPHEMQRQASALGMFRSTFGAIVGPAIGGFVAVVYGCRVVYIADVFTFAVSLGFLFGIKAVVRPDREGRPSFASLRVGFAYAVGRRDLLGTYLVDLAAMMLAYPMFMLPFVADHFDQTYALAALYAAMPLGALVASLTSKWTVRVHHYGRAVALAAALWGVGIAIFGWTSSLVVAVLGLFWAGAADSISAMFRGTMWNQSIPPDVRGRMASIEMLSYSIGPRVGQFRSGAMTAAFGLRTSLALGGLACAGVCAVLPVVLPELWNFDVRSNEDVAKVATLRAQEE